MRWRVLSPTCSAASTRDTFWRTSRASAPASVTALATCPRCAAIVAALAVSRSGTAGISVAQPSSSTSARKIAASISRSSPCSARSTASISWCPASIRSAISCANTSKPDSAAAMPAAVIFTLNE